MDQGLPDQSDKFQTGRDWVSGVVPMVWRESWVSAAEIALGGLGYQLADVERAGRGLLRLTLDSPNGIGVEDCEQASIHLSHLFEVEQVNYERLEVSSPGLDRFLRHRSDFEQHVGALVTVKTRQALKQRKQFTGRLQARDQVLAADGVADCVLTRQPTPDDAVFAVCWQPHAEKPAVEYLLFSLAELDSAKLVPEVNFRSHV